MPWSKIDRFREQAASFRALAEREDEPGLKSAILELAKQYDKLADDACRAMTAGLTS